MREETLVSVRGLHRRYGPTHAVRDVSFELRRGEVLGLLGPNGAGKTSTMNVVAGALAPSEGSVEIAGADLLEHPRQARRLVGYLPERPPLYRDLTVDEYLDFCARLRGVARRHARAAREEAKARTGLGETGGRLIGNLSKGLHQRVGIAQAIVHAPAVVVLDEPTVGLDPIQIREIRALVRELGSEHGVILSTHILPEVQTVCDRVQIIHEGRLVLNESVEGLGTGTAALRIRLARPPARPRLEEIPGVAQAVALGEGRFRLVPEEAGDVSDGVTEAAVREGWGLRELVPETRSLEDLFVAVTSTDAADPDHPPAAATS